MEVPEEVVAIWTLMVLFPELLVRTFPLASYILRV
jgi:hypothetical protein